jgi:hypothetical protein
VKDTIQGSGVGRDGLLHEAEEELAEAFDRRQSGNVLFLTFTGWASIFIFV